MVMVYPVVWLVVNILDTDAVDVRTKLLFLREINPLDARCYPSRFVIQWSIEILAVWVIFLSIRLTRLRELRPFYDS